MTERELPDGDWARMAGVVPDAETRIDLCKGWLVGAAVGQNWDDPSCAYLTNKALYVERGTDLVGGEPIKIPLEEVLRAGTVKNDQGLPRLVVMSDPRGRNNPADLVGVAIDLRPPDRGSSFGQSVARAIHVRDLQHSIAVLLANPALLLAEMEEVQSLREELAELGAEPDQELNAEIKRSTPWPR